MENLEIRRGARSLLIAEELDSDNELSIKIQGEPFYLSLNEIEKIINHLKKIMKNKEEAQKKIIIISDCMECPYLGECNSWKKLTSEQKFTLKFGVGIGKFILKGCRLEDLNSIKNIEDGK
jgi:hypothetical protein